jgi:hypothetical protein
MTPSTRVVVAIVVVVVTVIVEAVFALVLVIAEMTLVLVLVVEVDTLSRTTSGDDNAAGVEALEINRGTIHATSSEYRYGGA